MLLRVAISLLIALALASVAHARTAPAPPHTRKLLDSKVCPDGCMEGFCQQSDTAGGLRCAKCTGNLLVDKATGACACPKGKYWSGGDSSTCLDCPKGSYCVGGIYSVAKPPVNVACPEHMTTVGLRSTSSRSCVNLPGYSYNIDVASGNVSATLCPPDTYAPGLKKQRACVPCPAGFSTNGLSGATAPSACTVPAGWYLKGPGQAVPCPKGEWKSGNTADGNCIKCQFGVTTADVGATSKKECKIVAKGYYATSFDDLGAVNGTVICPQGYYCPGGNQTAVSRGRRLSALSTGVIQCPSGAWTQGLGASVLEECLTPPGYYTANGTTSRCPDGTYRADWLPFNSTLAASCISCGVGVKADRTDRIVQYLANGTEVQVAVTGSTEDCYIQAGQGLYYETITKTWRAKNCVTNNYGVTNTTYGLTPAPCRDCPTGTTASNTAAFSTSAKYFVTNADGTGGFNHERACVTLPGYGMSGRGGQRCDPGSYNAGNNYDACKSCPRGFTTTGLALTAADCVTNLGYGYDNNRTTQCPIGTYNDEMVRDPTAPCKTCPYGRTTAAAGSDSVTDCQFCLPGFGGYNCTSKCGGTGDNATFGQAGRQMLLDQPTPCSSCSSGGKTVTYSFTWDGQNDMYTPNTVARIGASSPLECLSEYSQIVDGSYYLPVSSAEGVTRTQNVAKFSDCVDLCSAAQCQLVTYDYNAKECIVRVSQAPVYEGMPWLALKVLPGGYVGTSPWSIQQKMAKSISSGMYTFYQEPQALAVGIQSPAPGRSGFASVQDCLKACDNAGDRCSGVTVLSTVEPTQIGKTCAFVAANTNPGVFKRTMVRADLNRLLFPSSFLCPSGYQQDPSGASPCTPLSTPTVVVIFMRAQATCSADLIASVRTAMINVLTDPTTAFGVYAPGLVVSVSCYDVPAGQGGARRLHQTYADLSATIQYPGTTKGGQEVLNACASGGCTGDTPAVVTGGYLDTVSVTELAPPTITIVQQSTATGEPLQFVSTYLQDNVPTATSMVLTFTPSSALSCSTTPQGTGVALFTCSPLGIFPSVTVTASAANPKDQSRVSASLTIYNITNCLKGSIPAGDVCEPCPKGSYAAGNATECTNCTEGFTTAKTFSYSAAQCSVCLPGRGTVNCTQCAQGFYSLGGAAATLACSPCAVGKTTEGQGSTNCTVCLPGYYGATCRSCPKGMYCEGGLIGAADALPCAQGYTTVGNASTSISNCTVCAPGYGSSDNTTCTQCPAGQYSVGGPAASTTCQSCPAGYNATHAGATSAQDCIYCNAGSGGVNCTVCPIGKFSVGGPAVAGTCQQCAFPTTTSSTGSTSSGDCSVCITGYTGASCENCAAGYGNDGNGCVKCTIGSFSDGTALSNASCQACPTGYTTTANASISAGNCTVCAPGYGSSDNTTCTQCPAGQYSAGGPAASTTCQSCPAGYNATHAGATSAQDCIYCNAGSGGVNCTVCPIGKFSVGGPAVADTCQQCAFPTTTSSTGSTSSGDCSVCLTGYTGTACDKCAAGYGSAGNGTCIKCAIGFFSDGTALISASCQACPTGSTTTGIASTAAANCSVCLKGYGSSDNTTCTQCPLGGYSAGGPAATTTCQTCATGFNTTAVGSSSVNNCTYCNPSYGGVNCTLCPVGTFSVGGPAVAGTCQNCTWPATTSGSGASSLSDCSACVTGFTNAPFCNKCAAGYGTDGSGACIKCAIGWYSNGTMLRTKSCQQCPLGTTTASDGTNGTSAAEACTVCTLNYTGTNLCEKCAKGYGTDGVGGCTKCAVGSWSDGTALRSDACQVCPTGSTTNGTGAGGDNATVACTVCTTGYTGATCEKCAAGYGTDNNGNCTFCDVGTFSTGTGLRDAACDPCPQGKTTSGVGATACTVCTSNYTNAPTCDKCAAGYGTDGSGGCIKCEVGFYSTGTALRNATCTQCPMGKTTATDGATGIGNCTVCLPGYTNAPTCDKCDAGYGTDGSGGCTNCTVGYFSNGTALRSAACQQCPTGTTNDADGAAGNATTACPVCTLGYATVVSGCDGCFAGYGTDGHGGCTKCPVGYVSDGTALRNASCTQCPLGTTTAGNGTAGDSTACTVCTPGYTGASCQNCAAGYGTDGSGKCIQCGLGFWSDGNANRTTACQQCPTGRTTAGNGTNGTDVDAACTVCTPGYAHEPTCDNCAAGYGTDGNGNCIQCDVGFYSDGNANRTTACQQCPTGSTTASIGTQGATAVAACTVCSPGYGKNGAASNPPCAICDFGYWSAGGSASVPCTLCLGGTTTYDQGSTSIANCTV